MRHLKKGRKFHRKKGQRQALFKNLISNFVLKEKMETTEAKAKEIRPKIEKLVTMAQRQNLAVLKILLSRLNKKAAYKLYHQIAKNYQNRKGGYTRIVKVVKKRKKDGAKMAVIEFV